MVLTDFCGGYCDVVPHVGLPVQRFGQCDLPIVHVDVELPLQVCVSINEVPEKTTGDQKFEPKLLRDCTNEASFYNPLGVVANGTLSIKRNL